ncbi:MAG: glycosyltransferase family 2 protein [Lachnospiraceae bacterium]|nr:glycosyltransferase family 2 protein [Lachnospiraceae bacterium]
MKNKILTISVAAYNAEKFLEKCLKSFINSSVLDYLEIIIVNDGSKDSTMKIAREYEEKYPNSIRVIDKENGGHGSTINASIANASGKYFKVVDSDDWVEKDGIERLVECLKDTDADLVLNPFYEVYVDSEKKELVNLFNPSEENSFADNRVYDLEVIAGKFDIQMHMATYKTCILRKIDQKIDEHCFYVDAEYILYPIPFVKTVQMLNIPVYDYLLGNEGQSVNIKQLIKNRNQHLTVVKHIGEYYLKADMDPAQKKVIETRYTGLVCAQYFIYYNMEPAESKKEFFEFESWLKKNMPYYYYDAYKAIRERFFRYIVFNRLTRGLFWNISINNYNKKK